MHSELVDPSYVEDEDLCQIKNKMRHGATSHHPVFRQIRDLRNQYSADLVGLITGNGKAYCGCGSQPSDWYFDTSDHAYFTATDSCATDNLTFVHEISHAFVSVYIFHNRIFQSLKTILILTSISTYHRAVFTIVGRTAMPMPMGIAIQ